MIAFITILIPVFLIETAVGGVVSIVSLLATDIKLLSILVISIVYPLVITAGVLLSPFINGYIRVYYRNAFTSEMDLNDLFYYFERDRYSRTLQLNLSYLLRMLLPAVLFYLPVVVYATVSYLMNNDFFGSVLYYDFFFILTVLSTIILTIYSLKYFTVFTLYVENGELSNREIFHASKEIMADQSGKAAKLVFSYMPWMLLCLTILPMLYVVPYMTQGLCIGAKWMTRAAYEE